MSAYIEEAWVGGYISHLSASSLRLLRVCPEAWRRRYILGERERPGEALVLGKAVHSALEHTHRQKVDSHEDLPIPEVVEYYNDLAWPEAVAEHEEGVRWDSNPDVPRNDGARILHAYHAAVSPRIQPIAVEKKIEFLVPGVPVPIWGFVDVEEQQNVIDLKTSKSVTRKPDANWRMQGMLYSGHLGKPTHFHSVSRAQAPSIATPLESEELTVQPHPTLWPLIIKVLNDYAASIEFYFQRYGPTDTWPLSGLYSDYRGGPSCNFCGWRNVCSAWSHERNGQ
jgi:hypothetical protein